MTQITSIPTDETADELVRLVPSTSVVQVRNGETLIASSTRVIELHEVDVPVRYYFPREDVRLDELQPFDTVSYCPFKGVANDYWALAGEPASAVAWSYPEPFPAFTPIAGYIAFYDSLAISVRQ